MQFNADEWRAILSRLMDATRTGAVNWRVSDEWRDGFIAIVPNNATYVLRTRDGDEQFPYIVHVSDEQGIEVSEFVTPPTEWDANGQSNTEIVTSLYQIVTRQVSGAEQKAASLIQGLDGLIRSADTPF